MVSGTVTSFNSTTDPVTIKLIKDGTVAYTAEVTGNSASYSITGVAAGNYTMEVSKKNHATRTYTLTVGTAAVTQDAKLLLIGDVTADGKVNIMDVVKLYAHVKGATLITDEYTLACSDVTGDSKVNIMDVVKLYAHVKGVSLLW